MIKIYSLSMLIYLLTDVESFILRLQGGKLRGLQLGIPHLAETFWSLIIPILKNLQILVIGLFEGCCAKVQSKVHIDSPIDGIVNNCPQIERIEARWDSETLRYSDRSSKAIDAIRIKCLKLKCLVLSDGIYFEMVVRSHYSDQIYYHSQSLI